MTVLSIHLSLHFKKRERERLSDTPLFSISIHISRTLKRKRLSCSPLSSLSLHIFQEERERETFWNASLFYVFTFQEERERERLYILYSLPLHIHFKKRRERLSDKQRERSTIKNPFSFNVKKRERDIRIVLYIFFLITF